MRHPTFTTDHCNAVAAEYGSGCLFAIPVNDPSSSYKYPEQVRLELAQEDRLLMSGLPIFCPSTATTWSACDMSTEFTEELPAATYSQTASQIEMPVVTTLHTVQREPDANQRAVLEEIAQLSDRLIVMSEHAARLLCDRYKVPGEKIDVIPHGVPDLPFLDPDHFKSRFGTPGKCVLLTFGLLSPNKGIENVIRALPAILARHKNVIYIISGATHPHIKRHEGERYRERLQTLAAKCGVSSHVIFNDRFMSAEELIEHLSAADIYITPYRHEAQVVSGTLATAAGAGKAIISTLYWHAKELLTDGRGVIVPFDHPNSIADAVTRLLDNDAERHAMRKRAYLYSRGTTWQSTAYCLYGEFSTRTKETDVATTRHPAGYFPGEKDD